MLICTTRILRNGVSLLPKYNFNKVVEESCRIVQVRCYAARKGTREKKNKAKVKVEVEKVGFIPHNQRNKDKLLLTRKSKKVDDTWKKDVIDNVYIARYFKDVIYPFAEAIQCHRETHHPEMYNKPNADVHVSVDLNMEGEKKTRFVENFTRIAAIPHKFDHGQERTVIAFSKSPEGQVEATDAGAQLCGGTELIKQIQNGHISLQDFKFVVAHPDILPELVALRGLLKRRFPNPKAGTLDPNMRDVVARFLNGISYTATRDEHEKDYGSIDAIIGTLNMEDKHLEENFAHLVKDVETMKPKRSGPFITRCVLWSPPSPEKLKVDHNLYLNVQKPKEDLEEEEVEQERIAL